MISPLTSFGVRRASLSSDRSLGRESARPPKARQSMDKGMRDELFMDLDNLLHQHCKQLADFVDGRLTAYHQELLQSLADDQLGRQRPPQACPRQDAAAACSAPPRRPPDPPDEAQEAAPPAGPPSGGAAACCDGAPRGRGAGEGEQASEGGGAGVASSELGSGTGEVVADVDRVRSDVMLADSPTPLATFDQNERMKMAKGYAMPIRFPASTFSSVPAFQATCSCRETVRSWVQASWFESIVSVLIISNVCFFGYEVQARIDSPVGAETPLQLKVVEHLFAVCFFLELVLRLVAVGVGAFFFGDGRAWNIIDLSLVLTSLLELCLELAQQDQHNLGYARIVRMARTVRILRVVRIMKLFRPLRILVYSICNTLRSLFWVLVLLIIIIYSFGVVFTMASSQAPAASRDVVERHFGSLWMSIYTLFKSITGGMDWQYCAQAADLVHPAWGALFVGYVAFSHFAVLNVVTGVVCQTAIESAQQDQDVVVQSQLAMKENYVRQLQQLFENLDSDRSGRITLLEFEEHLNDPVLRSYFEAMDLTPNEAWSFFKLLDVREECQIDIEEFVSGCLNLRGNARSVDVHMLMYESKWTMAKLAEIMIFVSSLKEKQERLTQSLHQKPSRPSKSASVRRQDKPASSEETRASGQALKGQRSQEQPHAGAAAEGQPSEDRSRPLPSLWGSGPARSSGGALRVSGGPPRGLSPPQLQTICRGCTERVFARSSQSGSTD